MSVRVALLVSALAFAVCCHGVRLPVSVRTSFPHFTRASETPPATCTVSADAYGQTPPPMCSADGNFGPYKTPCRTKYARCLADPAGGPNALCVDPNGVGMASQWGMTNYKIPAAIPGNATGVNLVNGTAYFALSTTPYWKATSPLGMSVVIIPYAPFNKQAPPPTGAFRLGISPPNQWANANASCVNTAWVDAISNTPGGAASIEWQINNGTTAPFGCSAPPCNYNLVVENTQPFDLMVKVYFSPWILPTSVVSALDHAAGTVYTFPTVEGWGGGSARHFGYIPTSSAIAGYNKITFTLSYVYPVPPMRKYGGVRLAVSQTMWTSLDLALEGSINPTKANTTSITAARGSPQWCETDASARPVNQGCYYHIQLLSAYGANLQLSVQYSK